MATMSIKGLKFLRDKEYWNTSLELFAENYNYGKELLRIEFCAPDFLDNRYRILCYDGENLPPYKRVFKTKAKMLEAITEFNKNFRSAT